MGHHGEVAEWSKAHAWKVCRRGTVSRVRIPVSPPVTVGSDPETWFTFDTGEMVYTFSGANCNAQLQMASCATSNGGDLLGVGLSLKAH